MQGLLWLLHAVEPGQGGAEAYLVRVLARAQP